MEPVGEACSSTVPDMKIVATAGLGFMGFGVLDLGFYGFGFLGFWVLGLSLGVRN